jgi:Domain of Unknown Function with PDB structure (DUF3857)
MKYLYAIFFFVFVIPAWSNGINDDKKRAEEIKQQVWNSSDKDFLVTQIPDKWKGESAVIIAKSTTLFYRKAVLANDLSYDRVYHYRIKLLDKKALEEYAQFSMTGTGKYDNVKLESFAGYKIIKPNGKEIEIPMSDAVKEKQELNNRGLEVYKLAIPNLEIGDILDYYKSEEETIFIGQTKYYSFDPVILQLNHEYPIMKQKISFDVMRRCFINIKSLNKAPSFKLSETADKEKNHYSLEDTDRESVKELRWFFPYREVPTIKFKVTYASPMAARVIPGFIDEPGVLKSSVSKEEVQALMTYYFSGLTLEAAELKSFMGKNYKNVKDKDQLAKAAYYAWRNIRMIQYAEGRLLEKKEMGDQAMFNTIKTLSTYYKSKKINHEILIGIPRQISGLNDLIFENELTFALKVNVAKPFYIGRLNENSMINEIDPDMQGETVYSSNGLLAPSKFELTKVSMPVLSQDQNSITTTTKISFTDLPEGIAKVNFNKSLVGYPRIEYQNTFMDYYDYKADENTRVTKNKKEPKDYSKSITKQRADYLSAKEEKINKDLKEAIKSDFDLPIEEAGNFKIIQMGRFDDQPAFIYNCEATLKGMVKKAGPNYLVDVGKFIEGQINLEGDEKERKYNVYMPYARTFSYHIELEIPAGFSAQGFEKLNSTVENSLGGFKSTAKMEGTKLVIDASKYYKGNFAKKEEWSKIVDFLTAAHDFSTKQILLQKN